MNISINVFRYVFKVNYTSITNKLKEILFQAKAFEFHNSMNDINHF